MARRWPLGSNLSRATLDDEIRRLEIFGTFTIEVIQQLSEFGLVAGRPKKARANFLNLWADKATTS